jgi:hypothetical protein
VGGGDFFRVVYGILLEGGDEDLLEFEGPELKHHEYMVTE